MIYVDVLDDAQGEHFGIVETKPDLNIASSLNLTEEAFRDTFRAAGASAEEIECYIKTARLRNSVRLSTQRKRR